MNALQKSEKTIGRHGMFRKGEKVFVAVSGGPDSIALFHLLHGMRERLEISLGIFHFNHMLRGRESDKDQSFVESLAGKFNVPVRSGRGNVRYYARERGLSLEEAARLMRYGFFAKEAARLGVKKVAVGHNRDDQAETVMLRIIKGTGLRGLAAIRPVLDYQQITIVRPLIDLSKDEVVSYLRGAGLSYRTDSSNVSDKMERNKIRSRVFPMLEREFNPKVREVLARFPSVLNRDIDYLEKVSAKKAEDVFKKRGEDFIVLHREKFAKLDPAIQFRVASGMLKRLDLQASIDFDHWLRIEDSLKAKDRAAVSLPRDVTISLERKEIVLKQKLPHQDLVYEYELEEGKETHIKEANVNFRCEVVEKDKANLNKRERHYEFFDYDKLKFPLRIRNRRPGDKFQPLGMRGQKKLKDFLIDRKVPSYSKNLLPVFVSGKKIFWVFKQAIADWAKVTDKTKKVLKISEFRKFSRRHFDKKPARSRSGGNRGRNAGKGRRSRRFGSQNRGRGGTSRSDFNRKGRDSNT